MKLKFLGANRQVTGSSYFLKAGEVGLIIDCGLFQERAYLARNWNPFPMALEDIDFLLLTHAHLDHAGLLPKLIKQGFKKPVLTTSASRELLPIMLLDSARIQEEDAAYKKKRHEREGRKGAFPEVPLYTVRNAERVFPLVKSIPYRKTINLNSQVSVSFHDAGHILGASMLYIEIRKNGKSRKIVFSGDIGKWGTPIIHDPSVFNEADYVIMESTYGDRFHEVPEDIEQTLCRLINETVQAGGNIVIPTFAVERAQELLFYLSRLVQAKKIPHLMIFLDSPMAVDVTEVFLHHKELMDQETQELFAAFHSIYFHQ